MLSKIWLNKSKVINLLKTKINTIAIKILVKDTRLLQYQSYKCKTVKDLYYNSVWNYLSHWDICLKNHLPKSSHLRLLTISLAISHKSSSSSYCTPKSSRIFTIPSGLYIFLVQRVSNIWR